MSTEEAADAEKAVPREDAAANRGVAADVFEVMKTLRLELGHTCVAVKHSP